MRFVLITALLLGACGDNLDPLDEPTAEYYYSGPEEAQEVMDLAILKINETAGCELIGQDEPGDYVNPIVIVDYHEAGPNVAGCAWLGEALAKKQYPRDVEVVRGVMNSPDGLVVWIHEIGHTLGLPHVLGDGYMNPWIIATTEFGQESTDRLESLCRMQDQAVIKPAPIHIH